MSYANLSRGQLGGLMPELMVNGNIIDQPNQVNVITEFGIDAFRKVAIEEWMGASPVYTKRIRAALKVTGITVADIFKGLQFDIGAPPQWADFQFFVDSDTYGEFRQMHCGPLLEVEPMGVEFVVAMCHDIQDPTFDATAAATNPRARFRPITRPPRESPDQVPHCHWKLFVDEAHEPLTLPEEATGIFALEVADVELSPIVAGGEGYDDYTHPLVNNIDFGAFSHSALIRINEEMALQYHLLSLSYEQSVRRMSGPEKAAELMYAAFIGIAAAGSARLCAYLDLGDDAADLAAVLNLNPALCPHQYTGVRAEAVDGAEQVRVTIDLDAPARRDPSWLSTLSADAIEPIRSAAMGVDPHWCDATARVVDDTLVVDVRRAAEPAPEHEMTQLTRASSGHTFVLEERPVTIVSRATPATP